MTPGSSRKAAFDGGIPDASLLREMIGYAAQRLMALETDALCGAGHGKRINHRNGFRDRDWETRAGTSCAFRSFARADPMRR